MTAWDMVSIAIVDLTFELAFYLLLGGGFVAGLLFLVWITKQAVFSLSSEARLWGSSLPLAPCGGLRGREIKNMLRKFIEWLNSMTSEEFWMLCAAVLSGFFLAVALASEAMLAG